MGAFYGMKILHKEIYAKTGEPWTINDVPKLWRKKTELWLAENQPN